MAEVIVSRKEAKALGLSKYFTGKACKRGHASHRRVSNGECLGCYAETYPQYYEQNQSRILETKIAHYAANKSKRIDYLVKNRDSLLLRRKRNYELHRDQIIAANREWRFVNRDAVNSRRRARYLESSDLRCAAFMRQQVRRTLLGFKTENTFSILGYGPEDLKLHIERQFRQGMSWGNYGELHIDHIVPVALMLKQGVIDPAIINSLSNLRPLWAKENLSKGAKQVSLL